MISTEDRLIKEIFFAEKYNDFNEENMQRRFYDFLWDIQKSDILEAYQRYKAEINDVIRITTQTDYDNLDSFKVLKDKSNKIYIKTHEVDTNRDFYLKENKTIKNYDIYSKVAFLFMQHALGISTQEELFELIKERMENE